MSAAFWGVFALLSAVLAAHAAGVVRGNVLYRRKPKNRVPSGGKP